VFTQVQEWSPDNLALYDLILQNGMAEFICNQEYLYEHYQQLAFRNMKLRNIDLLTLRFGNLRTLDLSQNLIATLEHIPANCKELCLDFNQLRAISFSQPHQLQFLSVSHNPLNDSSLPRLVSAFPELRCLNISHNSLCDLKQCVTMLGGLGYLKVLVLFSNPLSMLPIYYCYVTDHLQLAHFDGAKYQKEEPKPLPKAPPPEKKEVKEEKKDAKKDNKKGAKVEEKPG
jgi:Leucine-rich repeat (LRR) protein